MATTVSASATQDALGGAAWLLGRQERSFVMVVSPSWHYRRGAAGLIGGSKAFAPLTLTFRCNAIAAGGEERLKIRTAEAEVGDLAVGRGDDAVHAARLVADLDAHPRRDVEAAVAIDADAVGAGVVGRVGHVEVEESLLVGQRAIGLDLIAIDPMTAIIGDVEQRLVGREGDAVGELQSRVDDSAFSPLGLMYQTWLEPPAPPGWVDIDPAVVADDQVVAADALGEHRGLAAGVIRQDLAGTGGGRVEPAIGPKRLAVGPLRVGDETGSPCRRSPIL